jgi:hypothetical protein
MEFFMQKNRWYVLVGMLVIALTFSLVFISCGDDEEPDVWGDVTELKQLVGTWKGSYSKTQSIAEWFETFMRGDNDGFDIDVEQFGNLSVATSANITAVIDANYREVFTADITMTFSGQGIEQIWTMFSLLFSMWGDAIVVNNANHSVTMTEEDDITLSLDYMSGVQINQTGGKVLLPAGLMNDAAPEIILIKQ